MKLCRFVLTLLPGTTRADRYTACRFVAACLLAALATLAALTVATSPVQAQPWQDRPESNGNADCPDLADYYPEEEANWFLLERELARLMPRCLHSAEYFALLGAAQLNSGQLGAALESLERALLTDPDYGAARVDYAEALFLQGQTFPALEMNRQLLARNDLPPHLASMLEAREQRWRQRTRSRGLDLDVLLGYDSNLNRGPSRERITLTLSGEPIDLTLSPAFRATEGVYSQLRAAGHYSQQQPEHSHNWQLELNSRLSEDSGSDINQINTRYAWLGQRRDHSWQLGGALTHLSLGGNSLFTASEVNLRYQRNEPARCTPFYGLAAQHQLYHTNGNNLDAIETRSSGGVSCENGRSALVADLGLLNSFAMRNSRPGGDRVGWQARLRWQREMAGGMISTEVAHTRLSDREGYSEVLADGARREMKRSILAVQYRHPLAIGGTFLLNLYHQRQSSNIMLFSSNDSALEAGLRLSF